MKFKIIIDWFSMVWSNRINNPNPRISCIIHCHVLSVSKKFYYNYYLQFSGVKNYCRVKYKNISTIHYAHNIDIVKRYKNFILIFSIISYLMIRGVK